MSASVHRMTFAAESGASRVIEDGLLLGVLVVLGLVIGPGAAAV